MPEWSKERAADFDTWSQPTQQHSVSITTMNLGIDRIDSFLQFALIALQG
jgi:hypothetical protein